MTTYKPKIENIMRLHHNETLNNFRELKQLFSKYRLFPFLFTKIFHCMLIIIFFSPIYLFSTQLNNQNSASFLGLEFNLFSGKYEWDLSTVSSINDSIEDSLIGNSDYLKPKLSFSFLNAGAYVGVFAEKNVLELHLSFNSINIPCLLTESNPELFSTVNLKISFYRAFLVSDNPLALIGSGLSLDFKCSYSFSEKKWDSLWTGNIPVYIFFDIPLRDVILSFKLGKIYPLADGIKSTFLEISFPIMRKGDWDSQSSENDKYQYSYDYTNNYDFSIIEDSIVVKPHTKFTLSFLLEKSGGGEYAGPIDISISGSFKTYIYPKEIKDFEILKKGCICNKTFHVTDPPKGVYYLQFKFHDNIRTVKVIVKTSNSQKLKWPSNKYFKISSYYGPRTIHLWYGSKRYFHKGIDIPMPEGSPVLASASGKVEFTGWKNGYGYCIIIKHNNGLKTLYAHLSKILVLKGQFVSQGTIIAYSGNTGFTTGPHLHFGVIKNGKYVDPLKFLQR